MLLQSSEIGSMFALFSAQLTDNVNTCGIPQKKNKQIGSSTTTRRAQSLFLFIISIDPSAIHQRQKKQNPCCGMNMFMDESLRNVFIYETEAHL